MRVVVTGGAGFIGSHLVEELLRSHHEVTVFDLLPEKKATNISGMGMEYIEGSIVDEESLCNAFEGADFVFHEAALVSVAESVKNPGKTYEMNVKGSRNVLEAASKNKVEKVILASSAAVYGDSQPPLHETAPKNPLSPYGGSKLEMERLASRYARNGLGTLSLRYFNVYGPRQSDDSIYSGVISKFARSLARGGKAVIFGSGNQTRDFIYVKDVAKANIMAMESPANNGECINIATGRQTSVNRLFERMVELAGIVPQVNRVPGRKGDILHSYADISYARRLLGFEPTYPLEKGLEKTMDWVPDF